MNGREVRFTTRKGLAVFAYLALEGFTGRARLADLFWSELDEEGGRRNLRRELHRLREAGLRDSIEARGDSIGLVGPVQDDVSRFRAALAAGRPEQALRLYGGPLLQGIEREGLDNFEDWLEATRELLAASRRNALARHAGALEAAGDPRGALTAHLALLEEDQLQELHHREAMRLHALLGEREAALERFGRLRALLAAELGLEPLPSTVALAARVRAGELPGPATRATRPAPAPGVALDPPLVGREAALGRLATAAPGLMLIVGEPGVGKSRLVAEFAGAARPLLIVRGHEVAGGTPFYPVAEALRLALEDGRLDELEPTWRLEAARLVPELDPARPPSGGLPAPEGRARFLEGLARALRAAAGPGGRLILEDLHWFDAGSAELTVHLTRRAPGGSAPLLATARPPELAENPAAQAAVAELRRESRLERVELGPLTETGVLALVRTLSGGEGATLFSRRLHAATAGNPLFVLETLRELLESGNLSAAPGGGWATPYDQDTADYAELPIPPGVAEAVLGRVDRAGSATRRLLEAGSLSGDSFELQALAGATALSDWESLEALERALDARLLEAGSRGYRFAHDLVRRALAGSLGTERRRLLHGRLADVLAAQGGPPARIADHLERSGRALEAAAWRARAGAASAAVFAYQDALDQHARALQDGADGAAAFAARAARARLFAALDDLAGRAGEVEAMGELAATLGDPALEAEASLARARIANDSGRHAEALANADSALAHAQRALAQAHRAEGGPDALATAARLAAGTALMRLGRPAEAEVRLTLALERAEPGSVHAGEAHHALCSVALQRGNLVAARAHNTAALGAFVAAHDRPGRTRALMAAGVVATTGGDREAARAAFEQGLLEARELGLVAFQRALLGNLAALHLERGDAAAATGHLEAGLALARDPQDPVVEGAFLSNLATAYKLGGQLGRAAKALEDAIALADRTGAAQPRAARRISLAGLRLDLGAATGVRGLLDEARTLVEAAGLAPLAPWIALHEAGLARNQDDPAAALGHLAGLLEPGATADAELRAAAARLTAAARLEAGDAAGALACEAPEGTSSGERALLLAVRLDAARTLGRRLPAEGTEAQALAASGQVPPLDRLALEQALAAASNAAEAHQLRLAAAELLLELAGTLASHPDLRASLLARYKVPRQGGPAG